MVAQLSSSQTTAAAALPSWYCGVGGSPLGYAQLSAATLGSAQSIAAFGSSLANLVIAQCEGAVTNFVRWRDDGTSPTSSVGMQLFASPGGQFTSTLVYSGNMGQLRFIAGAGSPILNLAFYR